MIPNGPEQILERLLKAGLVYRQRTPNPISPKPGDRFQAWFLAVLSYVEPLIFGPNVIRSSATMLALAAQFQDWACHWGLVQFYSPHPEPLLARMMSLNGMIYGLNGYAAQLINTSNEIMGYYHTQTEASATLAGEPPPADETALPLDQREATAPQPQPRSVSGRGPSFEELFRK